MLQGADDTGRDRRDGRRQVYFAGARGKAVFQRQVRYYLPPQLQIPFRRR